MEALSPAARRVVTACLVAGVALRLMLFAVNPPTNAFDDHYKPPIIPEEHLFVPRPGSAPESDGWIVGTAIDYAAEQSLLNVFDAANVADGPLVTARLPYALPIGLHGKFV